MGNGLRLPAVLRGRRLSPPQERLIHELYAARERTVVHADLIENIFEDGDKYNVMRLVHETRRIIQGTGWHIATDHGRGYRMAWVDKDAPEEPPEVIEMLRAVTEDQRAIRADIAMLADDMRSAISSLTNVPAHVFVPSSVWTNDVDAALIATKGITGKLAEIASSIDVDPAAVTSRYRALKSSR